MKFFALTGGIATGKSTVMRMIQAHGGEYSFFDADVFVHALYKEGWFHDHISKMLGLSLVDGLIDKSQLRDKIFTSPDAKQSLEKLIHPLVQKECLAQIEIAKNDDVSKAFFADIPLLFETNFLFDYDQILMVAVSESTQFSRLKRRNAHRDDMTQLMIQSQIPLATKMRQSDIVIWNEGEESVTQRQVERFLNTI